jgi:hypothetical protein
MSSSLGTLSSITLAKNSKQGMVFANTHSAFKLQASRSIAATAPIL